MLGRRLVSASTLRLPVRPNSCLLRQPPAAFLGRALSSGASSPSDDMHKLRNIGISAHIDSGKTTLTERILFYTGQISAIHDVRGKDGVGAKMDSMDLEREKGITIQSAATYCSWKENFVNIIDTPGHVDFTIEVERALRVLDGAVLVLCSVSGVQSQSITVDRQMKRYSVPRVAFVNKLDRTGANPWKVIAGLRNQLGLNAAALQVPIGLEGEHAGVVDLVTGQAFYFEGPKGETVRTEEQGPPELTEEVAAKRAEMIERLGEVDEEIEELFLMEEEPSLEVLKAAIRRQTIANKFVPVFMGSAFKNKGVQALLDGVVDYLPNPSEVKNVALDLDNDEAPVEVMCDASKPVVALAFKLEESKFGQLTYMRIYQGTIKRGGWLMNVKTGKKLKVPRLVRMHSDEMQDITEVGAGDVVAMFGVDCSSMDSFTDGTVNLAMTSMFIPNPVMSLAVRPKDSGMVDKFGKALARFTKEDPTLRIHTDPESKETILSGMGELHLDIYVERMDREFDVKCVVGQPQVNYRETIKQKAEFNYLHKKQSGGSGQFARVVGYVEPIDEDDDEDEVDDSSKGAAKGDGFEFVNNIIGTNIPPEFISSCEKGARDAMAKGSLTGNPMTGVRVVVTDGQAHAVDSSDMAFRIAMAAAVREVTPKARGVVLEPIMALEVTSPEEFQGTLVSNLNRRMGVIQSSDVSESGTEVIIQADVPLNQMFGYSTDLRSSTQGKGEYSMEYKSHEPVAKQEQDELVAEFKARWAADTK